MTDIHRRLGVAALCGLTLVLSGCNDSSDPEPEPTASLQQPADGATSKGSVRYQDDDDDATPDADDSDDATPDADDDADDDGTPDADDDDDDDDGTPDTDDKDDDR